MVLRLRLWDIGLRPRRVLCRTSPIYLFERGLLSRHPDVAVARKHLMVHVAGNLHDSRVGGVCPRRLRYPAMRRHA